MGDSGNDDWQRLKRRCCTTPSINQTSGTEDDLVEVGSSSSDPATGNPTATGSATRQTPPRTSFRLRRSRNMMLGTKKRTRRMPPADRLSVGDVVGCGLDVSASNTAYLLNTCVCGLLLNGRSRSSFFDSVNF